MVAKGIAVQKAFGISQDKRADRCRDHCAVGIHHAFIDTQCRFFCFDRLLNLFLNRDVPRMEELKLTWVRAESFFIRQAVAFIRCGVARHIKRRFDRS